MKGENIYTYTLPAANGTFVLTTDTDLYCTNIHTRKVDADAHNLHMWVPKGVLFETDQDKVCGIDSAGTSWRPYYDDGNNLRTSTKRWKDLYLSGSVKSSSDARLKKNIQDIDIGLEFINKLHPVSYQYVDSVHAKKNGR